MKEKIIIDTDMGGDDYIALQLAILSEKYDVIGVTTLYGNTTLENATKNTFKALDMIGYKDKIKVYKGYDKPLKDYGLITKDNAFGENGFSGVMYEEINKEAEDENAVDYLIREVNNNPGEITIVAIGPLTNVAAAIQKDENFSKNVKELMIMGGSETIGNITPEAEFNFYNDPVAADIVFKSKAKITMLGWNISLKVTIDSNEEKYLQNSSKNNKFIYDITRDCAEMDRKYSNTDGACNSDSLLICHMLDNTCCKTKKCHIDIETEDIKKLGKSYVCYDKEYNATIITDIDKSKVKELTYKYLYEKAE